MGDLVRLFPDAPTGDPDIDGVEVGTSHLTPTPDERALDCALRVASDAVRATIRLPGGEILAASFARAAEAAGWYGAGRAALEEEQSARRRDLRRQATEIDDYLRAEGLPLDPEHWSRAMQPDAQSDGVALPTARAAWGMIAAINNPWMREAILAEEAAIADVQAHAAALALALLARGKP